MCEIQSTYDVYKKIQDNIDQTVTVWLNSGKPHSLFVEITWYGEEGKIHFRASADSLSIDYVAQTSTEMNTVDDLIGFALRLRNSFIDRNEDRVRDVRKFIERNA